MMSMPTAIRSFSRWTAASILRSSFSISSTMSAADELVDGERCGVDGFGRKGLPLRTDGHASDDLRNKPRMLAYVARMRNAPTAPCACAHADRRVPGSPARRAAAGGTHARELRAAISARWRVFAAGAERSRSRRSTARRSRRSCGASGAAGCRRARSRGWSPRSAASTGSCVLDRRVAAESGRRSAAAARVAGAARSFCRSKEVDALIAQPDVSTPRGLRDRAMIEAAVRDRHARLRARRHPRAPICISTRHYLTCIGKGNKERLIPIGEQATDWVRRYQRDGRPALVRSAAGRRPASPRLFVNARGGPLSRVGLLEDPQGLRPPGRPAGLAQPARAAPLVRHAPARARRRPARDPDDARTRGSVDDADLHARARGAAADGLRSVPPALVILLDSAVSGTC